VDERHAKDGKDSIANDLRDGPAMPLEDWPQHLEGAVQRRARRFWIEGFARESRYTQVRDERSDSSPRVAGTRDGRDR
jgi:hypothetical protein